VTNTCLQTVSAWQITNDDCAVSDVVDFFNHSSSEFFPIIPLKDLLKSENTNWSKRHLETSTTILVFKGCPTKFGTATSCMQNPFVVQRVARFHWFETSVQAQSLNTFHPYLWSSTVITITQYSTVDSNSKTTAKSQCLVGQHIIQFVQKKKDSSLPLEKL